MKQICITCKTKPVHGQGRCRSCYSRAARAGELGPRRKASRTPVKERIQARVTVDPGGCWLMDGRLRNGYALIRDAEGKQRDAHRVVYEEYVGPIPEGLQLDHVCHTLDKDCAGGHSCPHRRCVNPAHLEPVTQRENALRGVSFSAVNAAKTHCGNGHEFTPENTYYRTPTHRVCRACNNAAAQAYYRRKNQRP
jgi:hypothetical protein